MRIHVVTPVTTVGLRDVEDLRPLVGHGTEVTHSLIEQGPATIESHVDEALAVPGTLRGVAAAEADGADAVVIDCMGDPGVEAARELVTVPVMGPAQAAMHVAAMLGHSFSVLATQEAVVPMLHDLARRYGVAERLCSIRAVDIPVLELEDAARLRGALLDAALDAVVQDGAHVLVLGCTGMAGFAAELSAALADRGHPGIPVVDPITAALRLAEAIAGMGLRPSLRTYPTPPASSLTDLVAP
ncbi:aspartate/glutamate racemase family protein [Nocardioides daeguensis]|uniref:Aspartate/glutamate racemase family protein n=1 Tax=Nocardioides daeguensis TaxID=908359 RepID=A0ABP6V350_9ACTN|nr:aspartate/glutamate racemase family protein [Nocardioides daeguensis]MBV6727199.1 aspartate/glutamate racemase family protein [Nocardioides daeguensis]MCR1771213.1 aspartate/glutamate racemase family protein [Nocardioides daeguensis]